MPKCEICEERVDEVYTCVVCGSKFCEYCGDTDEKICIDCLEEEDNSEDEENEDWEKHR